MSHNPDPRELSAMLADDIEAVVSALHLEVKEKRGRRVLYCVSPYSDTGSAKLEVHYSGVRGKWNDWTGGRYGDALGLVAYVVGGPDPKAPANVRSAIAWARNYFGIDGPTFDPEAWARRRAEAAERQRKNEARAATELAAARRTAHAIWLAAQTLSPEDHGWAYLAARGIDLRQLPRLPRAVRYSPAQDWVDEDGEVRHTGPALMSAMQQPDGKFGALHRIWIDPYRPGQKADLTHVSTKAPVRKMWPSSDGCAIRIWRGSTGLSERDAKAKGVVEDMIICEGVEDGFSIATMAPEMRVVAAGSLPGLYSYVPPKHIRKIIVAADNDWDKPQALALLNRACKRLQDEFGKRVAIARSPEGKDFNDLLRGV